MVEINQYESPVHKEASAQLAFIESMILEGRKSTSYWGWNFVLWGAAYLVATLWSSFVTNRSASLWAWPVTMVLTGIATVVIARSRNKGNPQTTTSRAITAMWMGCGLGIFVYAFPLTIAGRFGDGHAFMGGIEVLLGAAHIASGATLRWRSQISAGLVWWVAALVTELTQSGIYLLIAFLAATMICNICFGIYLMVLEARDKARLQAGQVAHA
jgi:hypothetical protein